MCKRWQTIATKILNIQSTKTGGGLTVTPHSTCEPAHSKLIQQLITYLSLKNTCRTEFINNDDHNHSCKVGKPFSAHGSMQYVTYHRLEGPMEALVTSFYY